jgi:hypothetical protein
MFKRNFLVVPLLSPHHICRVRRREAGGLRGRVGDGSKREEETRRGREAGKYLEVAFLLKRHHRRKLCVLFFSAN